MAFEIEVHGSPALAAQQLNRLAAGDAQGRLSGRLLGRVQQLDTTPPSSPKNVDVQQEQARPDNAPPKKD
jgi:hypothetical protein